MFVFGGVDLYFWGGGRVSHQQETTPKTQNSLSFPSPNGGKETCVTRAWGEGPERSGVANPPTKWPCLGVWKNRDAPKWMVKILWKNGWFGGTAFVGNTHMAYKWKCLTIYLTGIILQRVCRKVFFCCKQNRSASGFFFTLDMLKSEQPSKPFVTFHGILVD